MNESYPEKYFQLQQAVQQCLNSFHSNDAFGHIKFQLVNDLVEPLVLQGEDKALKKIINILVVAASDFVGATKVMISMKQLLQTENEVLLEFEVSDNGPSITSNARSSLFTYKRSLAQVRSLVAQHGGRSVINSLYGVGTTFKFVLKYGFLKSKDVACSVQSFKGSLAGKKVLVAEDNELNQKTIAHLLKREGVHVDIACDGREAVELLEQNDSYDLLLLDLHLPLMDGFQSAVYIRKKLKSNIPIIALTAGLYANAKARCHEIGINRYIKKPLRPAELLNNVNYFLVK